MPIITGTAGSDTLVSTSGDDTIDGGAGNDTVSYATATAGVTVDLSNTGAQNTVGAGVDTLTSIENITGSNFDDTLTGDGSFNYLNGGSGDDTLRGGGGDDILQGSLGNDTLDGGAGVDIVWYTDSSGIVANLVTGIVTVSGPVPNTDTLIGIESVAAGGGINTLIGNDGDNTFQSGSGTTTMDGAGGNDDLQDWQGGTTVDGGAGDDRLLIYRQEATSDITLTFTPGLSTSSAGPNGSSFRNVEHLWLVTGAGNDTLTFAGAQISAGGFHDTWQAGAGSDALTLDLSSHSGAIRIVFSPDGGDINENGNSFFGFTSVETFNIIGGSGNDELLGGDGNDTLTGGSGTNTLNGGAGNDIMADSGAGSTIDGGAGIDLLTIDRSSVSAGVRLSFGSGLPASSDGTTVANVETVHLTTGSGNDTALFNAPAWNSTWAGNTWDGGAGTHDQAAIYFDNNPSPITTGLSGNEFVVRMGSGGSQVTVMTLSNVEYASIVGGNGDDTFDGYDNPNSGLLRGTYWLDGGVGNDTIYGRYGVRASYQSATSGVTVNLGLNGPQDVGGGRGSDTLVGVTNVFGSQYGDTIVGSASGDSIWSGRGDDIVHGGGGVDEVYASDGTDTLYGEAGADKLFGDNGNDTLLGGDDGDELTGGAGNDALNGGSNVDTAVVSGNSWAYTLTQASMGNFTVTGPDGTDTLTGVEYLRFDDRTVRLLPGTGAAVDFAANPSTYMGAIRDFDGNDLGGVNSWLLIGTADVNGDGSNERILVNRQIGRWAEVGTADDGNVYFNDYGWAGETRVVGIYIDPLVTQGIVQAGSDTDSQRRFQNDLTIENINRVLGQGDYDHNGLQEIYFGLTDGTAYLHAYMHADGNIQYANYQNRQQVIDYLSGNGWASSTWAGWFPSSQTPMEPITGASAGGLGIPAPQTALQLFAGTGT